MTFLQELETVLKSDERFISQDGQLLKPRVRDAVNQVDTNLIRSLVASPLLKRHFFKDVDGITIFDQEKFMWVVSSKEFLPDSYTSYRNKIGLSANDRDLITSLNEVTLVWPYKDCVLEGGQAKEDEKRQEIFYNETLAPDEVGRLLAPKAFCNATRYTAEGREQVTEFDEHENLLIKGNNLLALSSLLERYEGQVKCIYIDPPYNTGSDGFAYNDRFNHSTWLTFMRSRLALAKRLLSVDGVIFVQCDDNEMPYLKVLMDELFGAGNFIQIVEIRMNEGAANEAQNPFMPKNCEYGIFFARNRKLRKYRPLFLPSAEYDTAYNQIILNFDAESVPSSWEVMSLKAHMNERGIAPEERIKFVVENAYRIFQTISPKGAGRGLREAMARSAESNSWDVYRRETLDDILTYRGRMVRFYEKNIKLLDGKRVIVKEIGSLWTDIKTTGISSEGGVKLKNGKKPERLIERVLEMSSDPGDLVLDFHLGSGTTAAVAHKIGRRYIGVEQMEYIESLALSRLKNVIDGDASGISRAVRWRGGGSFVYVELAEQGEALLGALQRASTTSEVQGVLHLATQRGLLRPSVLPGELAEMDNEFVNLTLDEQKRVVAELVDKNRLYVNASDVDDEDLGLSEYDIAFTKSFYEKGE